jgi:hypothetical protein
MKIRLTEATPFCPACDAWLTIPGLQRCDSCGMECFLEMNETNHADQQTRLLASWGVVLRENGPQY